MSPTSSSSSTSGPSSYLLGTSFPTYGTEYTNALDLNNTNYQNILSQYGANLGAIQGQVAGVAQGYGALSQQVQGTIQGIGASQAQQIQDVYAQQSGGLNQSLISHGLGNTTVVGAMQRGVTLDSQKAQIALANQIAQLSAGYQAQLGGAGLQAQLQGAGLQNQAAMGLGGNLASYKTPYPNYPPSSSRSQQASGGGGGVRGGMSGMAGDGTSGDWAAGQGNNYMAANTQTNTLGSGVYGGSQLPQPVAAPQQQAPSIGDQYGGGADPLAGLSPMPTEATAPSTQSGDVNFDSESGWGY